LEVAECDAVRQAGGVDRGAEAQDHALVCAVGRVATRAAGANSAQPRPSRLGGARASAEWVCVWFGA
jgi:hypothetical protein